MRIGTRIGMRMEIDVKVYCTTVCLEILDPYGSAILGDE
jgi:hypothetical protein